MGNDRTFHVKAVPILVLYCISLTLSSEERRTNNKSKTEIYAYISAYISVFFVTSESSRAG